MEKIIASLQILGALLLAVVALATTVNLLFIATRPETISVVNAFIGLGVLIICFLAMARIFYRKGIARFRAAQNSDTDSPS